jgi:hypothetical protein
MMDDIMDFLKMMGVAIISLIVAAFIILGLYGLFQAVFVFGGTQSMKQR